MTLDEMKQTLPSSNQKDAYEQYQKLFGSVKK